MAMMDGVIRVLLLILCHTCFGLEVTAPSSQVALFQSSVILPCSFEIGAPSINPNFLAIIWYYENKELVRYDNKDKYVSKGLSFNEQEARQGKASLTILNVTIADQGIYRCLIIYSPDRKQREITLNVHATPEVRIQKKSLRKDEKNKLYCSISGFFPREVKVTWLRNNNPVQGVSQMETIQTDADGTFRGNHSVVLTAAEIQDHPSISCKVEHVSLQKPIQDSLQVQYGAVPKVNLISLRSPDHNVFVYKCEAMGYSPEQLSINWFVDGKLSDPPRGRLDRVFSKDGLFNREIYYPLSRKDGNLPGQIDCSVQHETLFNPIIKTLKLDHFDECKRNCHSGLTGVVVVLLIGALVFIATWAYLIIKKKYLKRFSVSHIHQEQTRGDDDRVTLYCMALNCPKGVNAMWTITTQGRNPIIVSDYQQYKDEESRPSLHRDYTMKTHLTEEKGLYNVTTTLSFHPTVTEYKKTDITCKFTCDGKAKERSLMCTFEHKKPEIKDAIKMLLNKSNDAECSVTLEKFYPRDIEIQWSFEDLHQYTDVMSTKEITPDAKYGTYTAVSECKIPRELLQKSGGKLKVRVMWSHPSMDQPQSREIILGEIPRRPEMEDIMVPPLVLGKEARLQCEIRGYYPDNLGVKWLRREAGKPDLYDVSSGDKYKIPLIESTLESDNTYTCTATLIILELGVTEQGSEFICRVTHPSLTTNLEKKTGELHVKGVPKIEIQYLGRALRATVSNLFPNNENIITWSRSKTGDNPNNKNKMEMENYSLHNAAMKYHDKVANDDGTITYVSELDFEARMGIDNRKKEEYKEYKITVKLNSGKSTEKTIIQRKGIFFMKENEEEIALHECEDSSGSKDRKKVDKKVEQETRNNSNQ